MASFSAGFLREADDSLTVTTDATGATFQDGFLRSPAGALVVTTSTVGATTQDGLLRAANGALVVTTTGPGTMQDGFFRDANGALVAATSGVVAGRKRGFTLDANGALVVTGLATFSPLDVAGLQAWYKADAGLLDGAGSPATVDGTAIGTWQDQSGNARHATQGTGAKRPVLKVGAQNGLAGVRFDGVNPLALDAAGVVVSQPDTILVVANISGLSATLHTLVDGITGRQIIRSGSATQYEIYAGTSVLAAGAATGARLFTAVFNGASSLLRVDRSQVAAGAAGANGTTGGIRLGLAQDNTTSPMLGDLLEVLYYNVSLSTTDRDNLETYLRTRWGTP